MQLFTTSKLLLSTTALFMLAACESTTTDNGGGDNGGGDNGGGDSRGAVTTGTTDGEMSSNGLPFATGPNFTKDDFDLPVLKLRAVRLDGSIDEDIDEAAHWLDDIVDGTWIETTYEQDAEGSVELVDLTINNLTVGEDGDWVVNVEIGDDESLLVNLDGSGCTISTSGIEYCFDSDGVGGKYVKVLYIWGNSWNDDTETWSFDYLAAMAGFEADPDLLALKGQAHYQGWYMLGGVSPSDDFTFLSEGEIAIDADFAAATIEGEMDGGGVYWNGAEEWGDGGDVSVTFDGAISGNGWNATSTDVDIAGVASMPDDAVQLDGVFYGPVGEETAGTIMIDGDAQILDGEEVLWDAELVGAGIFYADEND